MRFGLFLPPIHPAGENPTWALHRDVETIEWLDELGYDEVWIGEHHSGGAEIIASPEVFIAHVAQRTSRIKLGTGVSSLPYHHPLILADRIVLLDHLTRGRVMFGVGPGALPYDAGMMGIDHLAQRTMMAESLDAMLELLRTDEPVNVKTNWFTLADAQLQLRPFSDFDIAVAATLSPSGPRLAGRTGAGMLSIAATAKAGFDMLGEHWNEYAAVSEANGRVADRKTWRLVGPMYVAESVEKAREDVKYGLPGWVDYFRTVSALPLAPDTSDPDAYIDGMVESGMAIVGTPDMAIEQIERLQEQSGGFGAFLHMGHEWANHENMRRNYELFARHVMPHFQGSADRTKASRDWTTHNSEEFSGKAVAALNHAGFGQKKS